jgi:hypothetical protein
MSNSKNFSFNTTHLSDSSINPISNNENMDSSQQQSHENVEDSYRYPLESPRIILSQQTTFRSTILMEDLNENDQDQGLIANDDMEDYYGHFQSIPTTQKELSLKTSASSSSSSSSKTDLPSLSSSLPSLSSTHKLTFNPLLTILAPSNTTSANAPIEKEHSPMILDDCPPMLESLFSFYSLSSPSNLYLTITDFCNSSFDDFDIAIEKDRSHGRLRGTITERLPVGILSAATQEFNTQILSLPPNFALATSAFEISLFNAPSISCPHQIACEVQFRSGDRNLFLQFFNLLTNHLSDCITDRTNLPQFTSLLPPFLPNLLPSSLSSLPPLSSSLSSCSSLLPSYDNELELDLLVYNQFHSNCSKC